MQGAIPPSSSELFRSSDRLSFVYVEHATISRADSAVTFVKEEGVVHCPAASLSALLLGPGTRITHQAMALLGECGTTVVWVGEQGVRYYASGKSVARSSRLLIVQAKLVSNTRSRLAVARMMYQWRFPGEDTSELTMQQLRGREGARVRSVYRQWSERTGVPWERREYNPNNFGDGSPINQALSAAHAALYGIVHAAIVSLGCAPGLGFVHTGNSWSFVYDVADLYKAEITIPAAFEVVAGYTEGMDIGSVTRRAVRDRIRSEKVMERVVRDIQRLLVPEELPEEMLELDVVGLWNEQGEAQRGGMNYSDGEVD
ncbi:subtype I-E CRISPR-associated endonuclease Cas1 [Rothia sp. HMSC071C12]|uniref:type I-E CRISPR-associated endonuclease Cas1e n=1 Tax=Rothia sp. HMSC071C12 TaxID=1739446 RepID=UPI0008A249D3|nr:type I-E CRISPR-associated endonuclease Cas1e [Rothia sp. HMSC071C12]OFQ34376.1 subtype I-E CRISPR-associated endonuclease Cas1 [Rothia sp. HMSC071C12]